MEINDIFGENASDFNKGSNDAITDLIVSDLNRLSKAVGKDKETVIPTLSEETHKLLVHSLDPFQKFGVSTIYKKSVDGKGIPWDRVFKLLSKENGRTLKAELDDMTFDQMMIIDGVFDKMKRFKLGVGAKTYLKVVPGAFKWFELQTAHHMETEADFPGFGYGSMKLDGIRCMAIVRHSGEVVYVSRNGKPIYNIDEDVTLTLKQYPGYCFDGEAQTKKNFQASLSTFKKLKNVEETMDFFIFDMVTVEELETNNCELTYEERYERIIGSAPKMNHLLLEHYPIQTYADAVELYKTARERGEEGVIFKKAKGLYNFKRTDDWLKMKPLENGDFKVIGFEEGKPGTKYENMLGAFIAIDEEGIKHSIGGGISDDIRKKVWEDKDYYLGVIIEVEFMERTEIKISAKGVKTGGKLRHARFDKFRFDKDEINTKS